MMSSYRGVGGSSALMPSYKISPDTPQELQKADWYWGVIARYDVNNLMKEAKEGTFLVRDASTGNNEYTLVVRKGGSQKLIKIFNVNRMYGFLEPFRFDSVVDLIDLCQKHNLSHFNPGLDLRLLYPVKRSSYGDDPHRPPVDLNDILMNLQRVEKQFTIKSNQLHIEEENHQDLEGRMVKYQQCIDCYAVTISWFSEHTDLAEKCKTQAQPHETNELQRNTFSINHKLDQVKRDHREYRKAYDNCLNDYRQVDRGLCQLKMDLMELERHGEKLVNLLKRQGFTEDAIDRWMETHDAKYLQTQRLSQLIDYDDEALWLRDNFSRPDAEAVLRGREDGTFIIRASKAGGHALSIMCNNQICHCKIELGMTSRGVSYGFTEPFLIYPSLKELVWNYSTNSLIIHNDMLDTTLVYPAFLN